MLIETIGMRWCDDASSRNALGLLGRHARLVLGVGSILQIFRYQSLCPSEAKRGRDGADHSLPRADTTCRPDNDDHHDRISLGCDSRCFPRRSHRDFARGLSDRLATARIAIFNTQSSVGADLRDVVWRRLGSGSSDGVYFKCLSSRRKRGDGSRDNGAGARTLYEGAPSLQRRDIVVR